VAERFGDSGPGLGGGRRELVGAEHLRVGHQDRKREHADDRADQDAGELRKKLPMGQKATSRGRSSGRTPPDRQKRRSDIKSYFGSVILSLGLGR
jgi:hypothetical protein